MSAHNAQTVMMSRVEVLACATELQRMEEPEISVQPAEVSLSPEPVREALIGVAIGAVGLSALVMLFGAAVMVSAALTFFQ